MASVVLPTCDQVLEMPHLQLLSVCGVLGGEKGALVELDHSHSTYSKWPGYSKL